MGDFNRLKDFPEMFKHCKATEDRDLNVFEFLTEHISPIGPLIAGAEHESDEENDKPHQPIQSFNCGPPIAFFISSFVICNTPIYPEEKTYSIQNDAFFKTGYLFKVFRPPMGA